MDSGMVVEECALLGTPCLTIRQISGKIDLIKLGVNTLTGMNLEQMLISAKHALKHEIKPFAHYFENLSIKICNILVGDCLNFNKNKD